jgi:hypothetical protein
MKALKTKKGGKPTFIKMSQGEEIIPFPAPSKSFHTMHATE